MKKFEVSYEIGGYTFKYIFNSYEETMNYLRNNRAPEGAQNVKVRQIF